MLRPSLGGCFFSCLMLYLQRREYYRPHSSRSFAPLCTRCLTVSLCSLKKGLLIVVLSPNLRAISVYVMSPLATAHFTAKRSE